MNKTIAMFVLMCASVGCAGSATNMPTKTAADQTEVKSNVPTENMDAPHRAAFKLADGTEFVWDEVAKAWQWVDTPEHKQEVKNAANMVKQVVKGAVDYGRAEWDKQHQSGK